MSPADNGAVAGAVLPAANGRAKEQDRLRHLGVRLKNLRRLRGLSLQEVAAAVDVSPSFLSLIERGQSDISLSRFSRLADFYRISLSELLLDGDVPLRPPDVEAIAAIPMIDRGAGVQYRVIHRDHPQTIHVLMAPRSSFPDQRAHPGEDFWVLLHGRADLLYGDQAIPLVAPRTIRFPGHVPHAWRNPYAEEAELLVVASVPYW